jgi:chitinase
MITFLLIVYVGINDWKNAGVPTSKMTAGLAFYGRTMQAETDMTKDPHQYHKAAVRAPKGDSDDEYWTNPYCSKDVPGLSGNYNSM